MCLQKRKCMEKEKRGSIEYAKIQIFKISNKILEERRGGLEEEGLA